MSLADGLHKVGIGAFRHPWRVIAFWAVLLIVLGALALHFFKPASQSISIPGTPAQAAIDEIGKLFPKNGGGSGRIVFHSLNGTKIADQQAAIDDFVTRVGKIDGVSQAVSPFASSTLVSGSGTIAYAQIALKNQVDATPQSTFDKIQDVVASDRSANLQIETGTELVGTKLGELIGIGEIAGVVLALLVLVITFGSLVAAGMPLLSALLGVGVSMAGLFALSQVVEINSTTPVLAVMLGLAVGIDYSLFIINKYRAYVLEGADYESAIARALGTAGNAVVFAAFTVIIALSALSVVRIPFMTTMGLVGAGAIAVAALMALSVTPALLRLGGRFVFGRNVRRSVQAQQANHKPAEALHITRTSGWYKWGSFVVKHPVPILLVAVIGLAVIALPARDLQLGLPSDQYAASDSTQRKAYDLLSEGFGVGFNAPLTIVVQNLPNVSDADRDAIRSQALAQYNEQVAAATAQAEQQYAQALAQATTPAAQAALQQQVAAQQAAGEKQKAAALAQIDVSVAQYVKFVELQKVATNMKKLDNVKQVTPALVTDDGTAGIVQVIPNSAPASDATKALIKDLRSSDAVKTVTAGVANGSNVTLGVTGTTALQEDINTKLANAMPVYLLVVVGLSLILLIIAFRSILVPLKATLGYLLSVLAMFGAMVAVFQFGWFGITDAPGPLISFIPIIAIGILFGLAMDYEFFLVSSMHEAHAKGEKTRAGAKEAVVSGFGVGARVVTAAAIIMISVFGGFMTNHDSTIQTFGFGLAFGILVDAFIVRMTIVPAVMSLLGNAAWWIPKWLDRILPHVSIEGEAEKRS